jgi:hypothetical protein
VEARGEEQAAAWRAWCGGREPVAAEAPRWLEGSLGDRLCSGTFLARVRNAPRLRSVIVGDPGHWSAAVNALIRAVVFDGLRVDHPGVSMLLDMLAPIA